jgi:hypothetical protein
MSLAQFSKNLTSRENQVQAECPSHSLERVALEHTCPKQFAAEVVAAMSTPLKATEELLGQSKRPSSTAKVEVDCGRNCALTMIEGQFLAKRAAGASSVISGTTQ